MSILKRTTNYNLKYSDGPEIPTYLVNEKDNMLAIDNELKSIRDDMAEYESEQEQIDQLREDLTALDTSVSEYESATDTRLDSIESDVAVLKPESIKNIKTRLSSVEEKAEATADALHALTDRVANDEGKIDKNTVDIADLREDFEECCETVTGDITDIKSDILDLKAKDNELETEVGELSDKVDELDAHVTDLSHDVESVLTDINTNASNIATNASHIDDLEHRVDALEEDQANNEEQFASISAFTASTLATLDRMQEEIDELEPQSIEDLTSRVGVLEADQVVNEQQFASINATTTSLLQRVTALEQSEGSLDSRINTIASNTNANTANIASLTSSLNSLIAQFNTLSTQVINRDIIT